MAKICNVCGQQNDDNAYVCAYCRTPFQPAYAADDDQRTVVADDAFGAPVYPQPAPEPVPAPAPAPAPAPEPAPAPAPSYEYTQPAGEYTQPAPESAPAPAPSYEYTQPAGEYAQPAPPPAYQQPAPPAYQPAPEYSRPAPAVATPLNMSTPHYATPNQPQAYRPAPEKKNKGLVIGICVAAAVVVITAVILIIVFTSGGSGGGLPGSYVMDSMTSNGMTYNREQIKQLNGSDVTLTIDSNNTGTMTGIGGTVQMTFNPDTKTVSANGASSPYTLSGKTLTITDSDGTSMKFVKQ